MERGMTRMGRYAAPVRTPFALRATRGLHILRYAAADHRASPPRVVLEPLDPSMAELLLPPGMIEPVLVAPGDGLVIHAHRDVEILYEVEPTGDAFLVLEPVSSLVRPAERTLRMNGQRQPLAPTSGRAELERTTAPYLPLSGGRKKKPASDRGAGIILLGHVARRGDLSAPAGGWLGAPGDTDAIEGIELRWPDPPKGLDVAIRLTVNDYGRRTLPEAGLGMFCGTRKRAAPIIGLDIGLEGRRPEGWVVDCQAAFLGQEMLTARGARIALRGKTGREPLVGLRIRIGDEDTLHDEEEGSMPALAAQSGAKAGRVRIFRPSA
jgi:hypothetical protein